MRAVSRRRADIATRPLFAKEGEAVGGLFRLQAYGEVPSTNEIVKRAIEEGEPEGLAVGARADRRVRAAGKGVVEP